MSARTWLLATSCVVVCAAALALTDSGQALAQSAVKTVIATIDQSSPGVTNGVYVNNTSLPVVPAPSSTFPVSGSVNVSNTSLPVAPASGSTFAVSFPSPANVNATLAAGSTVAVDSSQTSSPSSTFAGASKTAVVTVNAYEGRQPFFAPIDMHQGNCTNCAGGSLKLSLGGKRLVIEYVSGKVSADSTFNVEFSSESITGTQGAAFLAPTLLGPAGGTFNLYAVNQSLRMYASDGNTLFASVTTTSINAATFSFGFITVHGYLVDL